MRTSILSSVTLLLALSLEVTFVAPAKAQADSATVTKITYDVLMTMPPAERRAVVALGNSPKAGPPVEILAEYWKRYRVAYGYTLTEKQADVLGRHIDAAEGGKSDELKELGASARSAFGGRAAQIFTLSGIVRTPHLTQEVAALLGGLGSKDAEARGRATIQAGISKVEDPRVVGVLTGFLKKGSAPALHDAAVWSLTAIASTPAIAAVTRAYTADPKNGIFAAAFTAHPDRRAAPMFVKALASPQEDALANAATALGAIGDPKAKASLERLVKDTRVATVVTFDEVNLGSNGTPVIRTSFKGVTVGEAARQALAKLAGATGKDGGGDPPKAGDPGQRSELARLARAFQSVDLKPGQSQAIVADQGLQNLIRNDETADVKFDTGSVLFASGYSYRRGRINATKFRLHEDTSVEVVAGELTTDGAAVPAKFMVDGNQKVTFEPNVEFSIGPVTYKMDATGHLGRANPASVSLPPGSDSGAKVDLISQRGLRSYANTGERPMALKANRDGDWLPDAGQTVVVDGVIMKASGGRLVKAKK